MPDQALSLDPWWGSQRSTQSGGVESLEFAYLINDVEGLIEQLVHFAAVLTTGGDIITFAQELREHILSVELGDEFVPHCNCGRDGK
jgi:hypothetical protein